MLSAGNDVTKPETGNNATKPEVVRRGAGKEREEERDEILELLRSLETTTIATTTVTTTTTAAATPDSTKCQCHKTFLFVTDAATARTAPVQCSIFWLFC
jgi:hypothetical protein